MQSHNSHQQPLHIPPHKNNGNTETKYWKRTRDKAALFRVGQILPPYEAY